MTLPGIPWLKSEAGDVSFARMNMLGTESACASLRVPVDTRLSDPNRRLASEFALEALDCISSQDSGVEIPSPGLKLR